MWAELGERTIDGVCVWFFPSLFLFFCIFSSHHPLVFLMLFLLLLYFLKAQVFIMFTSYIFFSVFFSSSFFSFFTHTKSSSFSFGFFMLFYRWSFFFFYTFSSRAACILCIDAVYCYFEALRCCCLCSRLCLFIIFIAHTHTHRIHIRMLYLHRSIFYIFGCFLVFVLTSQLFKTSSRYISVLCVRLYANHVGVECGSFQFWLLGERLSSVFSPLTSPTTH